MLLPVLSGGVWHLWGVTFVTCFFLALIRVIAMMGYDFPLAAIRVQIGSRASLLALRGASWDARDPSSLAHHPPSAIISCAYASSLRRGQEQHTPAFWLPGPPLPPE